MVDTNKSTNMDEGPYAHHNLLDEKQANGKEPHNKGPSNQEGPYSYLASTRWTVAYMGLYYGIMSYVYRVNISIALPFMVKSHAHELYIPTSHDTGVYNISTLTNQSIVELERVRDYCPEISGSTSESMSAEFLWTKQEQSFVLSAFYYGYLFQFPFGWIAGQYGGKHIISVSMAISSLLMLLIPVLARFNVYAVIAVRALLGLVSGATMPAWYKLVSQWALPYERSRFTAIGWLGQYIGTIFGFFTSGFLCAHGFDNGWGSVFYVQGAVGIVFVILWLYMVHDSPADHPRISKAELKMLTSQPTGVDTKKIKRQLSVPWRQLLTYRPVLAMFICHILECYLFYMILTCLPLYMKAVLRFDIQSNGMFSSLPFICSAVSLSISGVLADSLISRRCFSTTTIRKLFQNTGFLGSAVFILVTGFLTCEHRMWVIVLLCLCMCFDGIGLGGGFTCTAVDIAPRYASVIFGISNTFATIGGVLTPLLVAEITSNDTVEEWRTVFCIAAGCGVTAAIVFGLFSSSELAPWAGDKPIEIDVYCETPSLTVVENGHITENRVDQQNGTVS